MEDPCSKQTKCVTDLFIKFLIGFDHIVADWTKQFMYSDHVSTCTQNVMETSPNNGGNVLERSSEIHFGGCF